MLDYKVLVHYHNPKGDYFSYDMWQWQMNKWGQESSFSKLDYFGIQGELSFQTWDPLDHAHVIIKRSDWSSQSCDYRIDLLPPHLRTEVWLIEGDHQVYYSLQAATTSHHYSRRRPHNFDMALRPDYFDECWGYQGWLGHRQTGESHTFKLWAPTAKKVELVIYQSAGNEAPVYQTFPMEKGTVYSQNHADNTIGVWTAELTEDLAGKAYQYHVSFEYRNFYSRDPYTIATSPDGKRSAILTAEERQVPGFHVRQGREAIWRLDNPNQAVIYEMHIRDFSKSESSGVAGRLSGTFLGACQTGTENHLGQPTGFDYVRKLGVNVVQLQPISDRHKDYDQTGQVTYNWGYDPQNYNAPETSFSSNPADPAQAIRDLKTMIQAYHDAGISVTLDVVYNHIYSTYDSAFQATVPDYYYRMNANGSFQNGTGVGSETASEHEMFRKFMIDSLLYWVREFNIDGFRFDLMGIHDVETMNAIRQAMDEVDPRILLYGEGWDMGTGLMPEDKAKKDNAYQMPRIAFFNDTERDAVKGAEVYGGLKAGFVSGQATEDIVAKSILGSSELGSYLLPQQVLNYVEAHDNF
ncbi:type I pullulanase, partial [Streptococcus sp. DD11]|uniref:type I pullulanase n=1 Tax=Streptococcus sp. DD11 TaxID=1777879 RepID=UPI001F49F0E6